MRVQGWENKIGNYLLQSAMQPFKYGELDCVIFASNAVKISTTIDPMFEGRGKYDNLRDGMLLIRKYRGSFEGIMDYHFKRVNPRKAQRGDVVLKDIEGKTYGIVWSGKAWFKAEEDGLIPVCLRDCELAWRVE